jgi:phosphoribosylamine--glycine ligase
MNILVIGSGGREHALSWKLAQSNLVKTVFLAPGNSGVTGEEKIQLVAIPASDFAGLLALCEREKIDFVVVGPDQALADGIIDFLQSKGVLAFGPRKDAAQIEWSKGFSKELMKEAGIPTARFAIFAKFLGTGGAKEFLQTVNWGDGWVIKADGLALGKGVVVCESREEALRVAEEFLVHAAHGRASETIVIEERLIGREVSHFALCDGRQGVTLGFACDYKRIFDGDKGPNTGGMGAYSPADWLPADTQARVEAEIVSPLLKVLKEKGREYRGVLFAGLMITKTGPKVIEFNARFGDPETQCLLPLIDEDLLPWLLAAAKGDLRGLGRNEIRLQPKHSVHLVLAAEGYPANPHKGDEITVSDFVQTGPGKIFYAGVLAKANSLVTNGGRVLGLTALGNSRAEARSSAYALAEGVKFRGQQRRSDVGK